MIARISLNLNMIGCLLKLYKNIVNKKSEKNENDFEKFSLLKYKIFTLIFGKIKRRKLERGYYGKRYINFI